MTYLQKSLGGRPARGGPRMADPAGAGRVPLLRRSSLVLCFGAASEEEEIASCSGEDPEILTRYRVGNGPITSTGCLLLDVDFDEALRFVGEGYAMHRPHTTNHVFSVTSPDAEVGVHVASMRYGLRFPPHDVIVQFLNFYCLFPGQLSPHSYYCFSIFLIKCHLKGVSWSLDLFRYMFKKAKFVFISGFPGDPHPFQARFPDCHTFIHHPRPEPTPELLAHAQKLLEDCRPNPPHVYTVCTEQNLAEVGILISLERQFELAKAVQGGRPKHGLEESTLRPEDSESEEKEEGEGEEVETDEESRQPSYSEDVADVESSGGDMHPLEVIRKAKLLAQSHSREEEVQQEPPSGATSGAAAAVPNREVVPTRNQRKRKLIQVEEEETVSEQDVILTRSLLSKCPDGHQDGKRPPSLDRTDGDVQAEAEVASLSAALKDEDEILSSLQGLVDGFNKKVSANLSLISKRRAGAEFSSGVDFLASVETELSRLRNLAEAEHEQATKLEMQAVAKSEEVRSLEAERDRALAEKEQAAAEKVRAVSDFLQFPSFKEACLEKMANYYESWLGTEAGIKKIWGRGRSGSSPAFIMGSRLSFGGPEGFATAPTAVGKCVDPDFPSLSEESVQGPFCQEPVAAEVSKRSGRLVRKVGTNVRAYLEGFRRAHQKNTISSYLKTQFVTDHDASFIDSSFSEEIDVYFDHSGNSASHSCA
ncbi:unnamed protein product [Cuscuta campestris]|uniref:Transposase (putative) gypsy type domain-containing protein n=1 Tax=Cuscuta campestris TaxID=132261 RepID=A0A484MIQ1_9ASTE|nr:unnamed protein product [Cuscuta campestris]